MSKWLILVLIFYVILSIFEFILTMLGLMLGFDGNIIKYVSTMCTLGLSIHLGLTLGSNKEIKKFFNKN